MPIGFYKCQNCACYIEAFDSKDYCPICKSKKLEYWDVSTYCDENIQDSIPYLKVKIIELAGLKSALFGLSLSYNQNPDNMSKVANRLAFKQLGHNKFLESIIFWLDVIAPRYWWSEADTYRLSTKQSQSTMHTLKKDLLEIYNKVKTQKGIEYNFYEKVIQKLEEDKYLEKDSISVKQVRKIYSYIWEDRPLWQIKKLLPEGWLQRRQWTMSAKTLQNITLQRYNHRLPHWQMFLNQIKEQIEDKNLKRWIFKDKKIKKGEPTIILPEETDNENNKK